mgnify:CR=1 FL=1
MMKTDVVVIGAGAVGCAIARELSKYQIQGSRTTPPIRLLTQLKVSGPT